MRLDRCQGSKIAAAGHSGTIHRFVSGVGIDLEQCGYLDHLYRTAFHGQILLSLHEFEGVSFRAGILGSAFSVGSLFGNFLWGIVADRAGRKPALIGGLVGTIIAALMFGFSPNFWMAVFARFAWGFLNGNIGVSKTYMAEITDDSNNAKGMSLYGVIGGFGRTVGPVIGGFLIEPAINYPATFSGTIFETYPFALPVTIVAAQCLITVCRDQVPSGDSEGLFYSEDEEEVDSLPMALHKRA